MILLALDTTSRFGSVAVTGRGEVLAEVNYVSPSSHSRQMFRALDEVLKIAGVKLDDLEGLAVAAGPGSFTGIRIGLSLVKALGLASRRPIAAVSALEALALKLVLPGASVVAPMVDARKGEVFAGAYETEGDELKSVVPPGAYRPEVFLSMLPAGREFWFIGTGANLYRQLIVEKLGSAALFPPRSFHLAAEVGLLGERLLARGQGVTPEKLEPIYYRKSQAEEKTTIERR